MAAVYAMLLRLAGHAEPSAACPGQEATNWRHWLAGRAFLCGWWWFCAVGSGDQLGLAWSPTRLYEQSNGDFSSSGCGL
jgi:hypothetical protein